MWLQDALSAVFFTALGAAAAGYLGVWAWLIRDVVRGYLELRRH
jgi:hypothetical protein